MNRQLGPSAVLALAALVSSAAAQRTVLDSCERIEDWRVVASDGVEGRAALDAGVEGQAIRLDFEFKAGSGFVILRRELKLPLGANYRFGVDLRGDCQPNNLEFKLIDASGDSVWWVNQRAFEFPREWQKLAFKKRHLRFAWGPSGGAPLGEVSAIEFAIASATGGKGSIWFDRLTYEPLPEARPDDRLPTPSASAGLPEGASLDRLAWRPPHGAASWLQLSFAHFRELGGLRLEWAEAAAAPPYDVALSPDGQQWETVASVRGSNGGRDFVPLPNAEAAHLRISVNAQAAGGSALKSVEVLGPDFSDSPNTMYSAIARLSPRGWFPRYFLGAQNYWTVVGVAADAKEALIDVDGAVEVDKAAFRLEPFLWVDGRLVTWADVNTTHALADGYLPIPSTTWQAGDLKLEITALAEGEPERSRLLAQYTLTNAGAADRLASLLIAIRPFQVLTPWQELNITGGVSPIRALEFGEASVVVNGKRRLELWTPPAARGATTFDQGDVVEYIAAGQVPAQTQVADARGWAGGVIRYDLKIGAGQSGAVVLCAPFYPGATPPEAVAGTDAAARFAAALGEVKARWVEALHEVELELPASAARLANTFKSTQAYILINADGPGIQPGSRTYERSWIRDGALTSTALLYTGHAPQVADFLNWYARHQYPSGKVPCVVDRRGPDPVPEHDSTGQLIYALLKYYRFTGDRDLLERHLPNVVAGVEYLESLRAQRMTPEYRDGPPEKRAMYGLVTESISHEGYSAKPMHSYWDSFFTLRGLRDATTIAHILGRDELERRFASLRDDYQKCLYDSLCLAMKNRNVDYIPGCVELGDFDATSTAIGVFPCGELGNAPEPALHNTFERYHEFFRNRRDGKLDWRDYTPYEVRLINTFIRLEQPERAHELVDFFMGDQRPTGWNHWAEVVWRESTAPRFIGDMPHTWVGSDFLSAARAMFVYEDERDAALRLAAGVKPEWLADGVRVERFPTEYGPLSYTLREDAGRTVLQFGAPLRENPPGGIRLWLPGARVVRGAVGPDGALAAPVGRWLHLPAARGPITIEYAP